MEDKNKKIAHFLVGVKLIFDIINYFRDFIELIRFLIEVLQ